MPVRRLLAAEVDARDLTACRLLVAFQRRRGVLLPVALLAFDDAVQLVHTAPEHRRRGIASALLARAQREVPGLGYSADHTAQGAAFGAARGLDVPEAPALVDDAEVAWAAASVYLYVTHTEPEELLAPRPLRLPRRLRLRRRRTG